MKPKTKKIIGIWTVAALLIAANLVVAASHNQKKALNKEVNSSVGLKGSPESFHQDAAYKNSPFYMVSMGDILGKNHVVTENTALDLLCREKPLKISHERLSAKAMQDAYQHSPLYMIGLGNILQKKNCDDASHAQVEKKHKGQGAISQNNIFKIKSASQEDTHAFNGKTALDIMWGV
ncbi:hypothetical protein SAMN02746065_104118 [Desulfocicer vacuolatum DSM 3385]|uniref:Uncharacterized protein n=1 Tax=Desulfocicer vacuolatum DSM 3385 TaxID=1121400 RepID=A0A1W2A599_9BACT|nr:hypothetical protein [Desulfocicer vacuolatum]SMC55642.1 hypothetical protein SAMN02746065_104118 [Desulfocicer vacuolatum DSM 3385]